MNRSEFMQLLSAGLRRLPAAERARVLADYDSHFSEGISGGRPEAEVARSLGDPARLAHELRLDFELQAWGDAGSTRPAWSTLLALFGLLIVDAVFLLPWMLGIVCALALLAAGVCALLYGCFMFSVGLFEPPPGGIPAAMAGTLGWLSGGFAAVLASMLGAYGLANAFGGLRRLHRRVLGTPRGPASNSTEVFT